MPFFYLCSSVSFEVRLLSWITTTHFVNHSKFHFFKFFDVQVNLDIGLEVWSLFNFKVNTDIDERVCLILR